MMKNIVLAGGGDNDEAVFATALAAAQPFHAHLEFLQCANRARRGGGICLRGIYAVSP